MGCEKNLSSARRTVGAVDEEEVVLARLVRFYSWVNLGIENMNGASVWLIYSQGGSCANCSLFYSW